ncbi:30S ribosomal protein S24e [Methanosalsum natronophilum]|uniref:Small ribosomal subunit protein eS24 n=1 Tax=Methanosalsum natronophilum TaxID=768733 RepID=A0A3R7VSV4_9EURY|nr:30S ribosomal protein S24e [Methanosalsum natronophilum]MCS3923043.1 small subunit ribosomal protein S24e [Methanosalsum natronophilum]RQD82685.1 MAG: 30S ribosomal protein S24e [Methanosalsum natronophilum]
MEIEIKKDENNALLHRRELNFLVNFDGATPKRLDVKKKLAATFDVNPELVVIHRLNNMFGQQQAVGFAKIYEDSPHMQKYEGKYVLTRNIIPEAADAEETQSE